MRHKNLLEVDTCNRTDWIIYIYIYILSVGVTSINNIRNEKEKRVWLKAATDLQLPIHELWSSNHGVLDHQLLVENL